MNKIITLISLVCVFSFSTERALSSDSPLFKQESASIGANKNRSFLIGDWFGERIDGGIKMRWIATQRIDGRFEIHLKLNDSTGRVVDEHFETGFWGTSGPVFFTIIQKMGPSLKKMSVIDFRDATYNDAYQIVSLTKDEMTYKNYDTGRVFTSRKVGNDFKL